MIKHGRVLRGCVFASLCLLSSGAWAQVVTEFSSGITAGANPGSITAGPDGNLWFTEGGSRIGKITPAGVVTEYSSGISGLSLLGITAGPDGNLWFTENNGWVIFNGWIGRITPLGVVTEFGGPGTGFAVIHGIPSGITAGPRRQSLVH